MAACFFTIHIHTRCTVTNWLLCVSVCVVCTHIVVVVDLDHWCIDAGSKALHLGQGEKLVCRGLAHFNTYGKQKGSKYHLHNSRKCLIKPSFKYCILMSLRTFSQRVVILYQYMQFYVSAVFYIRVHAYNIVKHCFLFHLHLLHKLVIKICSHVINCAQQFFFTRQCVCVCSWFVVALPSLFWMAARMLSESQSMQGVVVQIWMWYLPTGCLMNMVQKVATSYTRIGAISSTSATWSIKDTYTCKHTTG